MATQQAFNLFIGEDAAPIITITGYTTIAGFNFTYVMSKLAGSPALVTKTSGGGQIAITSAVPPCTITITLLAADTTGFLAGFYWFSVFRNDSGANTEETYGFINLEVR